MGSFQDPKVKNNQEKQPIYQEKLEIGIPRSLVALSMDRLSPDFGWWALERLLSKPRATVALCDAA